METVCITGIGGYLGLATAYNLLQAGYKVIGTGSSLQPVNLPKGVTYRQIDIRDVEGMTQFFKAHTVTTVYHLAAIKYVGKCEADPDTCYAINTDGTKAVVSAMVKARVPHIVYASTYAVYDWSGDQVVLTEQTPTHPTTVYGKSKLLSEQIIIEAAENHSISRYHILRYGNIVGAVPQLLTHTPQSFLDKMIVATKSGETITLNGDDYATVDGTVARDFIDIRDVANVNQFILTLTESAIFNVSSGLATTLKELVHLCEVSTGTNIILTINPKTGNEPSSITIDNSLLTHTLQWQPVYSLLNTVQSLHEKLTT